MNSYWILITGGLIVAAAVLTPKLAAAQTDTVLRPSDAPLVLDSFSDDAPPALGTWDLSTDRVMGGLSDGGVSIAEVDGRRAMRMTGTVRLENNGGFVQNTLRMSGELDASGFEGIFLGARVLEPGSYYLFVRTSSTYMPWSYYSAPLEVVGGWSELYVPWSAFEATSVRSPLDPAKIRSISVVAYGEAMKADIAVDRIGLYTGQRGGNAPSPGPLPSSLADLER